MSNEIKKSESQKAFDRIKRFSDEGDIVLSSKEEEIFIRWNQVYKLYLQKKFTSEQIAERIAETHQVSIHTARNDYFQALALFSGSIKTNKKFLLHHHAENIWLQIQRFQADKSLVHLVPKLMQEYTRAVAAMPDELGGGQATAPIINYTVVHGQTIVVNKSYEEALRAADKILGKTPPDYSDFEDVTHE